jgi:hypothetical protein
MRRPVIPIEEGGIMKQLKMFSLIPCFVMIFYFLIFSFSGISRAEEVPEAREARIKNCISCCTGKKQVCININPDLRLCEAVLQTCVAACKSEGDSPSEWSACWSESGK